MTNFNSVVTEVLEELGITGEYKQIAQYLIQSKEDLQAFLSFVGLPSGGSMHTAVRMLQNKKREENLPTLEHFTMIYNLDPIQALENLFQQPLSNSHIKLFTTSNITLEELYERYSNNLTVQYIPFIKFFNQPKTEEHELFTV